MVLRDGTYLVHFESNVGFTGSGIIQVRGASFSGGDGGYRYRGIMRREGGILRGMADVHRVSPDAVSIFGPVDFFKMEITGRAVGGEYHFSGWVLGFQTLRLRFRLISATSLAAE